jgi:hypothetical protein
MAENQKNKRTKSTQESAQEIFDRAEVREKAGQDPFDARWQASLEIVLLMAKESLRPGQLLPAGIDGQKEWEFYQELVEKLDLPPQVCAVLITPSAVKAMPVPPVQEMAGPELWERDSFSIIISKYLDHKTVMQVSLPGLTTVGIDVFEQGRQLANYTYNTIEECLSDLARVVWIYFNPGEDWTEDEIIRYTENWFEKSEEIDLEKATVHRDFSYVHRPELLGLVPLGAAFKAIAATIPRKYDNLEKAIESANAMNEDFELGEPVITVQGILEDKEPECQALIRCIAAEMDMLLETMDDLDGAPVLERTIPEYRGEFERTARKVYERVTGRSCPGSVTLWGPELLLDE